MRLISQKVFRTQILGRSEAGYWRLQKTGDLPVAVLIGRRRYFTEESILEWLESKKNKNV